MRQPTLIILLCALLGGAFEPRPVRAESGLLLPLPERFGEIAAGTYDEAGARLGDASIAVERLADGGVRLEAKSAIAGSAHTALSAEFERTADGTALRLVSQHSESVDETGRALGVLSIDHRRREARCEPPAGSGEQTARVALPEQDRVANVALPLLFEPLAKGETRQIDFQILLCRAGARLIKARAALVGDKGGDRPIEVRYDMDLGPVLSQLAAPFLPKLSVWFDAAAGDGGWVGYRAPLFTKGPTVLVVRSGFSPTLLGAGR